MDEFYSYPENDYRSLAHHGVAGQHWGDRNGPPYPLSAKEHSVSEKKAGWRKSLENDGSEKNRKKVARDSSKYLNQIDKKNAFNKRYLQDSNEEIANRKKAAAKFEEKRRSATSESKKAYYQSKIDDNDARLKEAKKASNKLMKDISANDKAVKDLEKYLNNYGYNIQRKITSRNVLTKGEVALSIGGALLSGVLVTRHVQGTKYKVKNSN